MTRRSLDDPGFFDKLDWLVARFYGYRSAWIIRRRRARGLM